MNTHLTLKPKPDQIRSDYSLTSPEAELVETFRDMPESARLELLTLAMKMQRTG
jgi:hypothetical protein